MDFFKQTVLNDSFEVFDSRTTPYPQDKYSYFALTDALLERAGREEKAILHFWPTDQLMFLGMQDTKLPHFEEALSVFEEAGYDYVVRNSGGLGVVGDEGVINFSIILPNEDRFALSIDEGYQVMHDLVDESLEGDVEAKEVPDSYCPGDYDLSLAGKKIAGIAQRRSQGALAIMIYLSISGDQAERSQMIKRFYDIGKAGEETNWHYPDIDPAVMTTVNDALKTDLTVEDYIQRIKEVLKDQGYTLTPGTFDEQMDLAYKEATDKMLRRNKKMLKSKF